MKHRLVILSGLILPFLVPPPSPAATFNVSTVSGFQSALNSSSGNGQNDTINVAAGIYNVAATLSFSSSENYSLAIFGAGMGSAILDGGNAVRILNLSTTSSSAGLTVAGLTFRNGRSGGSGGGLNAQTHNAGINLSGLEFNDNTAMVLGGGANLVSQAGTVSVSSCFFRRNTGADNAGGLNVGTTDGLIQLSSSTFEDNVVPGVHPGVPARDGGGAILYVDGSGQIAVDGNTFARNLSADGGGGIMAYLQGAGVSLNISNNHFIQNRAQLDGGGCFVRINHSGSIIFNNNIFSQNRTISAGGAGVMIHLNEGNLQFGGNEFLSNISGEDGGGAWIWQGTGSMAFAGNKFRGNRAANNGGGAMISSDQGTVAFSRNTLSADTAGNVGGGLSCATSSGQIHLQHNTFCLNRASEGAGLYLYFDQSGAQSMLRNNILWNNTPDDFSQSGATSAIFTYSDIAGGAGQPWFGLGCISADPLFANPEAGNFALTWATFPAPGPSKSPCIDAGDPASPNDPDGTRADMGALFFNQASGVAGEPALICPLQFSFRAHPNPCRRSVVFSFDLSSKAFVVLTIYDISGRKTAAVVAEELPAGRYYRRWNTTGLPGGVYLYRLQAGGHSQAGRLVVLR